MVVLPALMHLGECLKIEEKKKMIYSLKNAGDKGLKMPLIGANAPNHPTLQLEALDLYALVIRY